MKRIYVLSVWVCLLLGMSSCTKDNFAYSGISKARFDGNMLEYMDAHPYDWNLTAAMIRHAGEDMVKLFEGNDENHKEITFFGITNHSIRRYLLENGLEKVTELDADWCRSILLQHIVDGKLYRKAIPAGKSAGPMALSEQAVKSIIRLPVRRCGCMFLLKKKTGSFKMQLVLFISTS